MHRRNIQSPKKIAYSTLFIRSFVSRFQPTKFDPLFWVKNPFSWKSNRNHVIFCLTFAQVAKSIQILQFLSNEKPQVNCLHKNQSPLHIPTKRIFYHLRPKCLTKPQLAEICTAPVLIWLVICTPGAALPRNFKRFYQTARQILLEHQIPCDYISSVHQQFDL